MSIRSILVLFCTIVTLSPSVPAQDSKSFPVGPGGRLFLKPDVDQILGRPYDEHVPMACTGECLWAAHPDGWAFKNGVNYYLISTGGIGFDIQIDNGTKGLTPYSAQFLPSRIEMKGGEGDFDIVGAKWISPDDVLCVSLKLSNTGAAEKRVWLRMVLPSSSVKSEGERSSWTVKQPYGDLTLLAQTDGFVAEEQVPEGKTAYLTEGETPASQHGSEGFDSKAAASGGAVLGSGFGGAEGHRAEWKIEVGEPIEDAVLSIRYARALKGDAEWKLSMPGIGKVERVGFPSTGGWGDTPDQFKLLTVKLGKIEKVTQTVQLVAVSNLDNTNIDALCIHPLGSEFPAATTGTTRLIREVALAPNSSQQIGLYVAAATQRAKAEKALARLAALEDPIADQISSYNGWLADNVPAFSASEEMTKIYWHRATSILKKNLFHVGEGRLKKWGISEGRWTSNWYANMISYGAGHQIREARWLRNPQYCRDMVSTWCENERDNGIFPNFIRPTEIGKGQYTDWITSTAWDAWCVEPDLDLLVTWADALKKNVDGWLAVYDTDNDGLLLVDSHWWTGMEWQPSFFAFNGWDKDKQDQQLERVDLTAYVYGDAKNLAKVLKVIGDEQGSAHYSGVAETIRQAVTDTMWDPQTKYFYSVEPTTHEKAMVKEVVGVYPFYFSMLPPKQECVQAWLSVFDPEELYTTWPVASASKKCPAYSQDIKFNGKEVGGCMWNGPTWPHANSLVMSALAATIRDYADPIITPDHFDSLLKSFTMAQFHEQKFEFPWTGEYYNGDDGKWRTDQRDYNHSTYIDLVIADMAGLCPRNDEVLELQPMLSTKTPQFVVDGIRYHGHDITIAWNLPGAGGDSPDGLEGYRVYVDGKLVHRTAEMPAKPLAIGLNMGAGYVPVAIPKPGGF